MPKPYIHPPVLKWQVVGFDVSEDNLTKFAEAGGRLAQSLPQALFRQVYAGSQAVIVPFVAFRPWGALSDQYGLLA